MLSSPITFQNNELIVLVIHKKIPKSYFRRKPTTIGSKTTFGNSQPFENDKKKNAFYFMVKARFVLKIFIFCPSVLIMWEISLIREWRMISRFMMAQTGKQIITIYILFSISKSKGNQATRFVHLIIYLEKYFSWKFMQRIKQED